MWLSLSPELLVEKSTNLLIANVEENSVGFNHLEAECDVLFDRDRSIAGLLKIIREIVIAKEGNRFDWALCKESSIYTLNKN